MEFIKGADVSSMQAMEDNGAKFYDIDGTEGDLLEILKKHGVNGIRLRIWNRPTTSFDRGDYCGLQDTVAAAKRVRQAGLKLMLDFHYCDSWADWKNQTVPSEWQGQDFAGLAESVYCYTRQVLDELRKVDASPDMVQIGNEIGYGLLWDFGHISNMSNMVMLLNQGIKAVREFDGGQHRTMVLLHVEHGADTERTDRFFGAIEEQGGLDYDIVGLSYYPYWAGPYEALQKNMRRINEKFGKPVMVVETAFPYTDQSNDDMKNVVTSELTKAAMGLDATVKNQKEVTEKIICLVRDEPNGCGVFYWEPAWYCVKGVGAVKGVGNEWENQAMFDCHGKGLESLRAFEI